MSTIVWARVGACALLLGSLIAPAGSVAAKSTVTSKCKPPVTGKGTSIHTSAAKALAINMWKSKVTSHYGASYANLAKAKVLTDHCQPAGGGSVGISALCTFTAQPCKTVKINISPNPPLERFGTTPAETLAPRATSPRQPGIGSVPAPRRPSVRR